MPSREILDLTSHSVTSKPYWLPVPTTNLCSSYHVSLFPLPGPSPGTVSLHTGLCICSHLSLSPGSLRLTSSDSSLRGTFKSQSHTSPSYLTHALDSTVPKWSLNILMRTARYCIFYLVLLCSLTWAHSPSHSSSSSHTGLPQTFQTHLGC